MPWSSNCNFIFIFCCHRLAVGWAVKSTGYWGRRWNNKCCGGCRKSLGSCRKAAATRHPSHHYLRCIPACSCKVCGDPCWNVSTHWTDRQREPHQECIHCSQFQGMYFKPWTWRCNHCMVGIVLHLVPRLGMSGTILPLPYMPVLPICRMPSRCAREQLLISFTYLMWSVSSLHCRSLFVPKAVHVGFMMGWVALGQVFL